jgi:serine/threonine-protein kinase Chk2
MSPPGHNDHQALMSSPPLQETQLTQVATQIFSQDAKDEDLNDGVWGYLDPINDLSSTRGAIKLNKQNSDDSQEHRGARAKSTKNASGYLIGRHLECDLVIDSAFISNRHCVIYKV